ncbi:hypothetical protein HDU67_010059 [Dinochytrium kinnereticum]|nr:hypothetical protein HDU67_010059 [Dinochytrium kinnereticum]
MCGEIYGSPQLTSCALLANISPKEMLPSSSYYHSDTANFELAREQQRGFYDGRTICDECEIIEESPEWHGEFLSWIDSLSENRNNMD